MSSATAILRSFYNDTLGKAIQADTVFAIRKDKSEMPPTNFIIRTWGILRLLVSLPLLPFIFLGWMIEGFRNTKQIEKITSVYPGQLDAMVQGKETILPQNRVVTVRSNDRFVITSDLHRHAAGRFDWNQRSETKELYIALLKHYGDEKRILIENGDVEEYWASGGSTYGVIYDISRIAANFLPYAIKKRVRKRVYKNHLKRIVANNKEVYRSIKKNFHQDGRYIRVVGNHDDIYTKERFSKLLYRYFPGLPLGDYVFFREDEKQSDSNNAIMYRGKSNDQTKDTLDKPIIGIATHGHHLDPWCSPGLSRSGKFTTWFACMVADATNGRVEESPSPWTKKQFYSQGSPNTLISVQSKFGGNKDYYTVDESGFYRRAKNHWGVDKNGSVNSPYFISGHTHLPMQGPTDPNSNEVWEKYINSGTCVSDHMITAIEWDGTRDAHDPFVQVVSWYFADEFTDQKDIVATYQGKKIAKSYFHRFQLNGDQRIGFPDQILVETDDSDSKNLNSTSTITN